MREAVKEQYESLENWQPAKTQPHLVPINLDSGVPGLPGLYLTQPSKQPKPAPKKSGRFRAAPGAITSTSPGQDALWSDLFGGLSAWGPAAATGGARGRVQGKRGKLLSAAQMESLARRSCPAGSLAVQSARSGFALCSAAGKAAKIGKIASKSRWLSAMDSASRTLIARGVRRSVAAEVFFHQARLYEALAAELASAGEPSSSVPQPAALPSPEPAPAEQTPQASPAAQKGEVERGVQEMNDMEREMRRKIKSRSGDGQ